jgi:hypothetical protein
MVSRRGFLQGAAALTSTSYMGKFSLDPSWAQQQQGTEWYDRPMRWAQVAFVDNDPGRYDLGFWLDLFRRCHVDAACLSAGGVTAFYPTEIGFHHRSESLGNMDCFGDFAKGCRELNMQVVARTDSHACRSDVVQAHPDWIAVDAEGKMKKHPSAEGFWITCALGPYNFDFMTQVHREIMTKYRADGIFTNRWSGSGMCYCEHCQKNFRTFSGLDLPRTLDPQNPARRQYILWNQARLFDLWRLWDREIKAINPHAAYIANAGGGALSDLDMKTIGELAPTLFADRQGRPLTDKPMMPWANGKNAKEYRATLGDKAIVGIFSLAHDGLWRDSVQNNEELDIWTADGVAQGIRPWFVKFGAQVVDRRWIPFIERMYSWHYKNESYLRNVRNLAEVGLVYSQQSALFYGGQNAASRVEEPQLGFYEVMIRARIPFEMVHDELLEEASLSRYRLLVLPNIAALSDKQCAQLKAYVEAGGALIATYETSLYDEWGVKRSDFGLASLFGVSYAGSEGLKVNSYLSVSESAQKGEPLLRGFEDSHRIINGEYRVKTSPASSGDKDLLSLIPDFPWLPMEEVYARPDPVREAGVFTKAVGKGKVIYFPADLDRTYWRCLDQDLFKLLRNAVSVFEEPWQVFHMEGPGIVDVALWTQKDSITVHLVNLTNPMYTKGPASEIFPIGEQRVRVMVPDGKRVKKAHLLVKEMPIKFEQQGGSVTFSVPSIEVHEVVALDFV